MFQFLVHYYENVECYAVLLAWIVVPLFFFTVYTFCDVHFGMFSPHSAKTLEPETAVPATEEPNAQN